MYRLIRSWLLIVILFCFSLVLTVMLGLFFTPVEPVGGQSWEISSLSTLSQNETDYPATLQITNDELVVESIASSSGRVIYNRVAGSSRIIDNWLIKSLKILYELIKKQKNSGIKISLLIFGLIIFLLFVILILPFYLLFLLGKWLWSWTHSKIVNLSLTIHQILNRANEHYIYRGQISIPEKVYEGDSRSLNIEIQRTPVCENVSYETLYPVQDRDNVVFVHTLEGDNTRELKQSLEILLLAGSGVVVGRDKRRQSHFLNSENIRYRWICSFPASSNQEIALEFNLIPESSLEQSDDKRKIEPVEIGCVARRINVVKFGFLTKNQFMQLRVIVMILLPIIYLLLLRFKLIPSIPPDLLNLLKSLPEILKSFK